MENQETVQGVFDQNLRELIDQSTDLTNLHITYKGNRNKRRIIFHSGPPNSGKTHDAISDFAKARTAIYCCPLRLLAQEVAQKAKGLGVDCDMITGEQTILARPPERSQHKACTVQLADLDKNYDVAIIDEIQMISDPQNGWAFTRALLGLNARTLEVCGDECAYPLVCKLVAKCGESVKIEYHTRPNRLQHFAMPLGSAGRLKNVKEGDCIVCFSKNRVKTVARQICEMGMKTAVIYGSLPPETKQQQIDDFNSSDESDKRVLVATDAIGMGLNAKIKRIVFNEFQKYTRDSYGDLIRRRLTPMEFNQISGRAGREYSKHGQGYVMAAFSKDVDTMFELKESPIEKLTKAGIRPPVECITVFSESMNQLNSHELPFDEMLDEYMRQLKIDHSLYFLCAIEEIKTLSREFRDIKMTIGDRYNFCCAPIQHNSDMQKEVLVKMAKNYVQNDVVTADWIKKEVQWNKIENVEIFELSQLDVFEDIYATLALYNWMNNKFPLLFPDVDIVNEMKLKVAGKVTNAICKIGNLTSFQSRNASRKRSFAQMIANIGRSEPDDIFNSFNPILDL